MQNEEELKINQYQHPLKRKDKSMYKRIKRRT